MHYGKTTVLDGYRRYSEIVRAVADDPIDPYEFKPGTSSRVAGVAKHDCLRKRLSSLDSKATLRIT